MENGHETEHTRADDEARPLYLETVVSGERLGAVFLKIRDGMTCTHGDTPDYTILRSITFASKSQSRAEKNIQQH